VKTFGKRLRKLRQDSKFTQKDLSKKLNISESSVGMYERDEREPSFELTRKIAQMFNVTTDYLLCYTDHPNSVSPYESTFKEQNRNYKTDFDPISEINRLLKEYGIEQSGFFDIESWKAMGPEDIEKLESYFKFITEEAKRREKDQQD